MSVVRVSTFDSVFQCLATSSSHHSHSSSSLPTVPHLHLIEEYSHHGGHRSPEAGPSVPTGPQPREVIYCAICTFPPEYCEFGPRPSKCRTWLHDHQPELYSKIWSEEAISSNLANLTTKQAEDLEKEAAKKERKTVAKEERAKAEMAASRIVLKKEARTKRKVTTSIIGLHLFTPPLPAMKVVAKA